MGVWPDKTLFFTSDKSAFLAYRVAGNYAVVLGDPVGPPEKIQSIIVEFSETCENNDWRPAFHQTLPDYLETYRKLGFRKLKIGDEAIVDLSAFDLAGKHFKKIRQRLNTLESEGVRFERYTPPLPPETFSPSLLSCRGGSGQGPYSLRSGRRRMEGIRNNPGSAHIPVGLFSLLVANFVGVEGDHRLQSKEIRCVHCVLTALRGAGPDRFGTSPRFR